MNREFSVYHYYFTFKNKFTVASDPTGLDVFLSQSEYCIILINKIDNYPEPSTYRTGSLIAVVGIETRVE